MSIEDDIELAERGAHRRAMMAAIDRARAAEESNRSGARTHHRGDSCAVRHRESLDGERAAVAPPRRPFST